MVAQRRGPDRRPTTASTTPTSAAPRSSRLRELHAAMDRAVLDAYGWTDIPTDCEFLLDYEDDEDEGAQPAQEAVALPLARRRPRRGARPPDRAQRRARGRRAALGRRRRTEAEAQLAQASARSLRRRTGCSEMEPTAGRSAAHARRGARAAGRDARARPRRPVARSRARARGAARAGCARRTGT